MFCWGMERDDIFGRKRVALMAALRVWRLSRDWVYLLRDGVPCARGGVGVVAFRFGDGMIEEVGGGTGCVLLRVPTCVWNWVCC